MHFIGIADTEFIRGNIPMTKEEVRILTLAKAKIKADDIIIDIGAGTGSLSIEAALLAPKGKVFALEKNLEGIDLIKKNAEKFQANNITVINAYAPEGMADLPQADVIFIGGSGKNLQAIIDQSATLLKKNGKIIVNAVTVETIYNALTYLHAKHYKVEAFSVGINRINNIGTYNMFQALNQITIIVSEKM